MAKTFHLEIIAANRIFYQGECEHLVITAIDGLLGIMAGHEPLVTVLPTGELKYMVNGQWHYAAISEGFIQVMPESSVILADTCEPCNESAEGFTEAFQINAMYLKYVNNGKNSSQ